MNEIVKYHNDMSSIIFPGFTPMDHNLFSSLVFICKGKGTMIQDTDYDTLKELADFKSKDDKRFIKTLDDFTEKLLSIKYRSYNSNGSFIKFNLFSYVENNAEERTFSCGITEQFAYILNFTPDQLKGEILPYLSAGYTSYELKSLNRLKTTYSKMTFRQLMRYRRTGWWQIGIDDFRQLMDVSENYSMKDISRRIIQPMMKELPNYFEDLKIEKIKGGPGGKSIVALKFTFKPKIDKAIWTEKDIFLTKYNCPDCGQPLYSIWRHDGEEFFGHKDGWKAGAPCKRTFSSYQEIVREYSDEDKAKLESDHDIDIPEAGEPKKKKEKSGYNCRMCGRPLYIMYNKKGEMFYGHLDGYKPNAFCSATYGSVAEIKGLSETPTGADHEAIDLEEAPYNSENVEKLNKIASNMFQTIKND